VILIPFRSLGNLSFGDSRERIRASFGEPQTESRDSMQDLQFEYPEFVARFHEVGGLVEVSANLSTITINDQVVPFSELSAFIRQSDNEAFESLGFLISPNLGFSFDSCCPNWVTVFSTERAQIWLAYRSA